MKKKIYACYFLLLSICSSAQMNIDYFRYINNAEINIIEKKYTKAVESYNYAFETGAYVWSKDIHNAIICNILEKNYAKAVELSLNLIEKGVDIDYFYSKDIFKPMLISKEWLEKKKQKNLLQINIKLRKELIRRYKNDQDVDNIKRHDYIRENCIWFRDMLLSGNFPTQEKTGVFTQNNKLDNDPYEIMLIHYFDNLKPNNNGIPNDSLKLTELLQELVKQGKIRPSFFVLLNNTGKRLGYMTADKHYFFVVGDSVYVRNTNEKHLSEINKLRYDLGLHSIDDYRRIIIFSTSNENFELTDIGCIGIFNRSLKSVFKSSGFENIGHKKTILNIE